MTQLTMTNVREICSHARKSSEAGAERIMQLVASNRASNGGDPRVIFGDISSRLYHTAVDVEVRGHLLSALGAARAKLDAPFVSA